MKAKEDGSGSAAPRKRVRRGIEGWRTLISQQRALGDPPSCDLPDSASFRGSWS
jgi:hypothetical protein